MATVGDIAIVVGADVGPMVRELGKGKGALSDFGKSGSRMGGLLGTAMGKAAVGVGVAATAIIALTKVSMSNIDALSKQARALGISVASFQSMAMVAEEAGVQSDQLSKILIKMQDNIASLGTGTKAQVAQFAALGLSMSDLAGLGADEQFALIAERMAALTDPTERTAAALNLFGKSGADAITMLDGFGAAAEEAAAFQAKFGIAVSDIDAQNIEAANDAMGRLGMAMSGLGNVLAATFAPAIEGAANGIANLAASMFGVRTEMEEFFGSLEEARAILGEDVFNRMLGKPEDIAANAETLDDLNTEADRLLGIAGNLDNQVRSLATGLEMIGQSAAASAVEEIAAEINRAREEFDAGQISAEEFTQKLLGIEARASGIAAEMANINGSDFGGVIGALGGLRTALSDTLAMAIGLRNALPGGAASAGMTEGTPLSGDVSGLMPPSVGGVTTSPRPQGAPALLGEPEAGRGGGGGGGSNPMTARIEALVASLETEREIIAAWYEESLATLNSASEAELAALGGKHEAMERLEDEHQKRLAAIREMGNQWGVEAALSGGAEILGAMGQNNKKALKLSKAFAAAEALVSTYQGAAKELKNGTFGFAAAAAVIAKGMGFISAIKSASESGGGGRGRGSASAPTAAAAAPAQQNAQTFNLTVQNDPFGIGANFARQIAQQLNEASRNGTNIRASVVTQ